MSDLKLSKTQQQVVDFGDGALQVIAGAGSGKTRVLTERIKKLVNSSSINDLSPGVLALTFTNKAAKEMSERLDQVMNNSQRNIYVGTIHGFCMEIISRRSHMLGYEVTPVILKDDDCKELLQEIIQRNTYAQQLIDSKERSPSDILRSARTHISKIKQSLIVPDLTCSPSSIEEQLYIDYFNRMKDINAIDFDDIISLTYELFTRYPNIASLYEKTYTYVCVDEAQDLTLAHYSVIKSLCQKVGNLMMVGDPNQAIFSFAGSSIEFFIDKFVADFKTKTIRLEENFRSAKSIVDLAQKIDRTYPIVGNVVLEGEVASFSFKDESAEAQWIVKKIRDLSKDGHPDLEMPINIGKFAILARNRSATNAIEEELRNQEIPFYKQSESTKESESTFFRCFELGLKVLVNSSTPWHLEQLKSLLENSNSQFKPDSLSLVECLRYFPHIKDLDLGGEFQKLSLNNPEFGNLLSQIHSGIEKTDFSEEECELLLNDLKLWKQLWKNYEQSSPYGSRSLSSFLNSNSLGLTKQIENRDHQVAVLTIHASKGLEWEVVFLVGLCQGVFPDFRSIDRRTNTPIQDEKNNFLVAVTRAKRLLYLTYPRQRLMPWGDEKFQNPSIFLRQYAPPVER